MPETATTRPTQAATAGRAVLFVVFCCTFFSVLGSSGFPNRGISPLGFPEKRKTQYTMES